MNRLKMAAQEYTGPSGQQYSDEAIFQQLESYPWDSDTEFQSGLQAILGPNPSPEQAHQLELRARCFYFSRYATSNILRNALPGLNHSFYSKNNFPIDFDAYQAWRSQKPSPTLPNATSSNGRASGAIPSSDNATTLLPSTTHNTSVSTSSSEPPAPYPTSFSQMVELITTGQPIPGIKQIPDTVLEGRSSQDTLVKRKKPWEKDDAGSNGQDTILTDSNA